MEDAKDELELRAMICGRDGDDETASKEVLERIGSGVDCGAAKKTMDPRLPTA